MKRSLITGLVVVLMMLLSVMAFAGDGDKYAVGKTVSDFSLKDINGVDPEWSGALPATILYEKNGLKAEFISGRFDTAKLEAKIKELLAR